MRAGRWTFLLYFLGLILSSYLLAQTAAPQPRVTQAIDESQLTVLKGNTHPLARPQFDRGAAPANLALNRMLLVLQRSLDQETALKKLLDDQQDKSSPNYHKWLAPEEFGQQFGPADQDLQSVTSWLQSHGFQVSPASKGRTVIEFSGSAAQVQETFHTAIHKYVVSGEEHWANASDPQIPAALAPVVGGVRSLHNFRARPLLRNLGVVSRSKATGSFTSAQPLFTVPDLGGCGVQSGCFAVGPYDFATIYNVLPLWTAMPAIDGTGQSIAIVGETDINPQDITDFRTFFGLPAPNLQVIHDGLAPGILQNEETESDLDVEWSGAVAPGATIYFVVAESTETTQGIDLSALHIVDNNLAPVMSESYGTCELYLGAAGNQFFSRLWQQAAAEGMTVMIAAGDAGSAVCDQSEGQPPQPATHGLQVSGTSSTPYNVAVGGTDFGDLTNAATYWSATNGATTQASVKSYIPETTWNDTCTNSLFGTLLGYTPDAETNCNNSQLIDFVSAVGGSGGKSSCTNSDGQTPASCTAGYAKPFWQSALTPNDGARDVPDVSLFASGGLAGSFYVICEADAGPEACNPNAPTASFLGVGGTSASAPAFAGIMALVNQQTGSRQGNANYVLYKLATQQPSAFHDVTTGTIAMPCQTGSPNCTTLAGGDLYGVLSGYNAAAGYDLATGLGSVNAFNLVSKWNSVTLLPSITTLSSLTPTTSTHGQPVSVTVGVAPQSGTGTPAGIVALAGGPTGTVTDFDSHPLSSGGATWTTSLLPGGTYSVTAQYSGDGSYSSSDSATGIPVVVNKENGTVGLGLVTFDFNGNLTSSNATAATYGSPYILRTGVTGTTCSSNSRGQVGCPTGNVSLTDNGSALDAGTYTLNILGYVEDQTVQLAGGTHAIQATYAGDNSFNASSVNDVITITPAATFLQIVDSPNSVLVNSAFSIAASISSESNGVAPTGTFTFYADGKPLPGALSTFPVPTCGSAPFYVCLHATLSGALISTSGPHAISVTYNGDGNYAPSSAPTSLSAFYPTTATLTANPQNPQPGASVTLTALIDTPEKGITPTGTVVFSALTINDFTFNLPGNVTLVPTVDASGNSALLATLIFTPNTNNITVGAAYSGDTNFQSSSAGSNIAISVAGNDFGLSATPPTVIVPSPGITTALNLIIDGQAGYQGTVNFASSSCSGLPAESGCSFSPPSVTGSGGTTVLISTAAPHSRSTHQAASRPTAIPWFSMTGGGMLGLLLAGAPFRRKRSKLLSLLLIAFLLCLPSCGGGSSGGGGGGGFTDPGTLTGTYTVTVTATSGSLTHTASFQLVVQ